jgi:hypothetical protein
MFFVLATVAILATFIALLLVHVSWHYAYYYVDARSLMGSLTAAAVALWFGTFVAFLWWTVFFRVSAATTRGHDCGLTVFQHACKMGLEGIVSKA